MANWNQPSPIVLQPNPPQLQDSDPESAMIDSKDSYRRRLKKWQKRLLAVQQAYYHQGRRVMLVFEGWDAAGKGGSIRRITEPLDPRGFRVFPISAPRLDEHGRHYLYRFQRRIPTPGKISIFDRSYYGRVLVERVEGFASNDEWQRAYQEINEFERMLTDDGVRIIKFFVHITPEEQLERFLERLQNPIKQWKLTEEDIRNRRKWPEYEVAINDMFRMTSTEAAPWHLVASNHKWYTRVAILKTLVKSLSEGVDITPPPLDPAVIRAARKHLGVDQDIIDSVS